MKLREKNPVTREMIETIRKKGFENKSKLWVAVAEDLNRIRRKRFEVSLNRLEKHAKANEKIIVPGVVLGNGVLKKKITIAALKFSGSAKEKIEKSGGKCLSIEELFKDNPKGKGIRIMG